MGVVLNSGFAKPTPSSQRRPKKIQKGIPRSSVDLLRGSQGAFHGGLWAFLGGRMGVGLNPDVRASDMG